MSIQKIVLGGGCFWCIESIFQRIVGVEFVVSGYAGGHDENPVYDAVCSGITGHAEVIEVSYDNSQISLQNLLKIFFTIHDPTTLNRQGNDVGTQYRSAIFYNNTEDQEIVETVIDELKAQSVFENEIVTQIDQLSTFYPAEDYHQNYFERNPSNPYCQFSIPPKRKKVVERFASFLKDGK